VELPNVPGVSLAEEQTSRLPVILVVQALKKEFQDEQTPTGKYRRLPDLGHGGFRAIAQQFDDKPTYRGPAADRESEFRLAVHNATINADTIDHDIDTEYAVYRLRHPDSAFELRGQPACD
jgi:hypothetical protein